MYPNRFKGVLTAMSTYKCIIVDDEPLICQLIQKLGNWEELNIEVVAICHDGETAVREIVQQKPDIVLSDIKMPIYNGIQIIEQVNQLGIYPLFVIISGYSQFEYAQRAIQLKAIDYLVKPIHKDKLNDALRRCCETLLKQAEESVMSETLSDIQNELLWTDLYTEKYKCLSENEFKTKYGIQWNSQKHYIGSIMTPRPELLENRTLYIDPVYSILKAILGDNLDSYDSSEGYIYFMFHETEGVSFNMNSFFQKAFLEIKHLEKTLGDFSLVLGCSAAFLSPSWTLHAFMQSTVTVNYRFERGMNAIYMYESIPIDINSYKNILSDTFTNNLIYHSTKLDSVEVSHLIADYKTQFLKMSKRDYMCLMDFGSYVVNIVMNATHYPQQEILLHKYMYEFHFCKDYDTCFTLITAYARQVIEFQKEAEAIELSGPVKDAKKYIEEHYEEKIYLDDIAKHVCLSSSYLSAVFKKESGYSITEYINVTRCNVAKELLKSSQLSTQAIADKIGYADEKYFLHQFKKQFGITPAQFRRIYA